jgi:hypothetical protein
VTTMVKMTFAEGHPWLVVIGPFVKRFSTQGAAIDTARFENGIVYYENEKVWPEEVNRSWRAMVGRRWGDD